MVVLLAEIRIPGVRVRVELHEGERALDRSGRPELGERDRMVATEDYRDHPGVMDLFEALPYLLVALLDKAGHDGDVAVVDNGDVVEDRNVL